MRPAILGISGPALTPDERALFAEHPPRGVILFSRNIQDPAQLAGLTAELHALLPLGAHIAVDQEGGRVARLRPPHWPALPPAASLHSAAAARAHGRALGAMVKAVGFTMTCAPVLDIRVPGAADIMVTAPSPATLARWAARSPWAFSTKASPR